MACSSVASIASLRFLRSSSGVRRLNDLDDAAHRQETSSRGGRRIDPPRIFRRQRQHGFERRLLTMTRSEPGARATVSDAVTLPRLTLAAMRSRTGPSSASMPGGSRTRMSRPLALTLLSSHDQP